MRKLIFATFLIAFIAGVITGWALFPQPQWMFDAFGHWILFKN